MSQRDVTVLAATGKTGRRVVAALRSQGHDVREASRSSATRFDWEDAATWAPAIEGADAVYLVADDSAQGTARLEEFVALAHGARVGRVVLLSARQWVEFAPAYDAYARREEIVRAGGVPWVILRPVWFLQNFTEETYLADGVVAGELVHGFGAGRHPFIDAVDIAEVAAAVLTEDGHEGQIYELSGPAAVTVAELAAEISAVTGTTLAEAALDSAAYERFVAEHYFADGAREIAHLMDLIRDGRDARVSDGVERVLGRPARTVAQFASEAFGEQRA